MTEKEKNKVGIPEGYVQEDTYIDLNDHRSITVTNGGVVKINNKATSNKDGDTFSKIQIFYSKEKNRYLIFAEGQNTFTLDDIYDTRKKSGYKLSYEESINVLDLDVSEFDLSNQSIQAKNNKKNFFSKKTYKYVFDCPNYVIIG